MAGIIKAGAWESAPTSTRSVAFNLEDMSRRADDYLVSVQQQAAQIIAEAQQQAQRIEQDARERGRQAAIQEAKESLGATLDQQLATLTPALRAAIEDIRHSKATWLAHWERETVRLATAIAQRVIRREVRQQPEITTELVREALELAVGTGQVTIQLSPEDLDALRGRTDELAQQLQSLGAANIVANPQISPGGCRVLTEFGTIDQTFEAQLARIAEELA